MQGKGRITVWFGFYVICAIFILSGAFNYGFSRFWMAVPFMGLAFWIGISKFRSKAYTVATLLYCVCIIGFNLTLEKNPFLFPILQGGEVVVQRDSVLKIFSDGSIRVLTEEDKKRPTGCTGCGPTTIRRVSKGERFKVSEIKISHPDFGTEVSAVTEVGRFGRGSMSFYEPPTITFTKKLERPYIRHFGVLMLYPAFPILLASSVYSSTMLNKN